MSHQGWLRSLMRGGPPRSGHKGELRLFCMTKPEEEKEQGILFKQNPRMGVGMGGEAHTGSLSSQAGSTGEERTST